MVDYANGKIPAGIAGRFNAVDVRDLAAGIVACTERGRRGEGYILSNRAVDTRDLFHLISTYTGAKEVKLILPVSAAHVLAFLSGIGSFLTGKPGLLTPDTIHNLERNNHFSCEKAERELGFTARPFEATIRDMAHWLHRDGRIKITGKTADRLSTDRRSALKADPIGA
jgi:dihydroflavonol-4-reductase